jgi:uncharacterized protein with von Willebrand factor type A (vWA) domain
MGLLDREIRFLEALREAGVPVALSEVIDATRAMGQIDLMDRESLRQAFAATCVKRPQHRATYDRLFDLWWPPVIGDPTRSDEPAGGSQDELAEQLRDELRDVLESGDEDDLRRLAQRAVQAFGRTGAAAGRQNWFSYRVLRAMSPDTLMASLLERMLAGQDRDGLAERVARQTITERIKRFQDLVEAEIRRRLAEERGVERISRTTVKPPTEQVDFLRASREDLLELRRQVFPLARRLATRLTAKQRLGKTGQLDFRRTVRASLSTGGVPVVTHHKPRRPHKPELVVLCDVSGSVASFSQFTMVLAYALREQFTKVRTFAFIDTVDEVTDYFRPGGDVGEAITRITREADLVWFDGHSDYGHSIEEFAKRYPDACGPRTSLLILGDARNNYRATSAPVLRKLVQQCRHAYWLNPEPRASWGSGDSATTQYAEVIEMVECRNAAQLAAFVQRLLPT